MRQMTEYERAYMLKRIEELEGREYRLRAVLTEQNFGDDSSKESEPEGHDDEHVTAGEGDINEQESGKGRRKTRGSWNIILVAWCCCHKW
jgi:hypothetical protein